jgi:hypothetical protein
MEEYRGRSAAFRPERPGDSTRSEVSTMKIRVRLGIAAAFGLFVAISSGLQARAQLGTVTLNPLNGEGIYNAPNSSGLQQFRIPPQGTWAQIINVTSKWMVVQNQLGQQFPISSDRVRQFLIRWPHSTDRLTPQSVIEVFGPNIGSNTIIADHMDVYENDAQNLVSPTATDASTFNWGLNPIDVDQLNTYGVQFYMTPEEYSRPARSHVVGRSLGTGFDGVKVEGLGQNWYTIQPSLNGMSVTQITLGSNSYAQRGDLVYIVPENISPRSLDVTQLVLYKKIPFRAYQP